MAHDRVETIPTGSFRALLPSAIDSTEIPRRSSRTTLTLVISLPGDERRHDFLRAAAGSSVKWSFFDAHTSLQLPLIYSETEAKIAYGRALRPAELGCYSSHYAAWSTFLASDFDLLLVFEDDVWVDWPFIESLIQLDLEQTGEYYKLFAKMPCGQRLLRPRFLDMYHHLVAIRGHALGTQAYILSRRGASALLKHCRTVRRPIDVEMGRYWAHGVQNLAILPYHVVERYRPSRIGEQRFWDSPRGAGARSRALATRALERFRRAVADLEGTLKFKQIS